MNRLKTRVSEEERQVFIARFRFSCLYLASPLVISFLLVDYFFRPDLIGAFIIARLIIIPVSLVCYFAYKVKSISEKYHTLPAMLMVLYFGLYHAYLVQLSGYETSPYYAGLNLVTIIALGFLPWPISNLIVMMLLSYGPYVWVVFDTPSNYAFNFLVPHLAFIFSTIFLCTVSFFLVRKLRFEEIESKMQLEDLSEKQAAIILEKTREGIYLEKLTSQFSPQVVEAIKSGQLDLAEKYRREISVIFIDVENSTQRSNRIDHYIFTSLIEDFFSSCIEIFLKHEVTIGTYLGDGILAFCNAPNSVSDHRQRVIAACNEILELKKKKENYYFEKWRTAFNVRVGIEAGYATVGFFPSQKHGTYTALGDCVNIASRLCARAKSNTICTSKQFIKTIPQISEKMLIEKHSSVTDIKGFEGDAFELLSIIPVHDMAKKSDIIECSLCQSEMNVVSEHGETLMLACQKCGYRDLVDKHEIRRTG